MKPESLIEEALLRHGIGMFAICAEADNSFDYWIAGLECGSYAVYNPELMMIAIGPDIKDVHSTQETLILSSVPKMYNLIKGILLSIG